MEIISGFEEKLQCLLERLSAYLSKKEEYLNKPHMLRSYFPKVNYMEWVLGGVEYYIADGGWSRVISDYDTHEIFLTSNSTKFVEERWSHPEAAVLREKINSLLKKQWEVWDEQSKRKSWRS